jgi:DNA-binding LacI/PurR family transcriptional regulator
VLAALRTLEEDRLIAAEPRRGYRVLESQADDGSGSALAFVVPYSESGEIRTHYGSLLDHLQRCADLTGRPLLVVGGCTGGPAGVVKHLSMHGASGVVISGHDPALLAAIARLDLPLVGVDIWHPEMGIDTVIQDGFTGGYLAARHLAERGHRKIAYVGRQVPPAAGLLAPDRLGGALAGLLENGLDLLPPLRLLSTEPTSDSLEAPLRELLSGPSRPTGVIALWAPFAATVAAVADRVGLKLGADLEIVGWGVEENADPQFPQGYRPPRVTWSVRDMARTVVARLDTRRNCPALPPAVLKVPATLKS